VFAGAALWAGPSLADEPPIPPGADSTKSSPPASAGVQPFALPDPEQNARLQQILSTLGTRPGQTEALAQLEALLSEVLEDVLALGEAGRLEEMERLLRVVRAANPTKSGLDEAHVHLERLREIELLLAQANAALQAERLVEPPERNAAHYYRAAMELQPGSEAARAGLQTVQERLIQRAHASARQMDFEMAYSWLDEAAAVLDERQAVEQARADIAADQVRQAERIEDEIRQLIAAGEYNRAEVVLIDLIALGGSGRQVAELRRQIEQARLYGGVAPGQLIRDELRRAGSEGPPLVVVPAGSFLMGSAEGEPGHTENESPQHRVKFTRGFAIGQTEITVGQFRQFVEATRYRTRAEVEGHSSIYDERSGRLADRDGVDWRHDYAGRSAAEQQPVLHVSWDDAMAYVDWLAGETGRAYRLPSEAEFEYALRGGSIGAYWWGEGAPAEPLENLTGAGDESPGGRGWSLAFADYGDGYWGPAPAGSLRPNAFGLHDMAGNVSEWVMDCWHANYLRAPRDGRAWTNPGCERRVVRGGYWAGSPAQARSAARLFAAAGLRGSRVGFRVARDL
jgi:formylglycine-generating enzyme required for sulfatase activity